MLFKIISDSASDLFLSEGAAVYRSVPLKIVTDEKEYVDVPYMDVETMVAELQKYKGRSGSSCPNAEDWMREFEGADAAFCITITGGLSGSSNAARIALEEYRRDHPEFQGYVVDTLSTGPENALIIERLQALIGEGLPFAEIVERIEAYRQSTHLIFCLESLKNLANNGRVNGTVAKVAGLLGIRIVGKASSKGTLEITDKVRGAEKAIQTIFKNMLRSGYNGGRVRIHHCLNLGAAERLAALLRERFENAEILIAKTAGLCSFYAEAGGLLVGFEE
ncbi:MAG: DegV family protein [Clostridia bacterium]|nr:DegV family protein [Clostridia bacterium]